MTLQIIIIAVTVQMTLLYTATNGAQMIVDASKETVFDVDNEGAQNPPQPRSFSRISGKTTLQPRSFSSISRTITRDKQILNQMCESIKKLVEAHKWNPRNIFYLKEIYNHYQQLSPECNRSVKNFITM